MYSLALAHTRITPYKDRDSEAEPRQMQTGVMVDTSIPPSQPEFPNTQATTAASTMETITVGASVHPEAVPPASMK